MANMSSHQAQATNYWINQTKQPPNNGLRNAAMLVIWTRLLKKPQKFPLSPLREHYIFILYLAGENQWQ